jgi:hypothetical protein
MESQTSELHLQQFANEENTDHEGQSNPWEIADGCETTRNRLYAAYYGAPPKSWRTSFPGGDRVIAGMRRNSVLDDTHPDLEFGYPPSPSTAA